MKKAILTLALTALSLGTIAQASTEVGNGGDVVVCADFAGGGYRVELLDFYEGRVLRQLPNTLNPQESMEQNLHQLISEFGQVEPERAKRYAVWAITFFGESVMLPGVKLVDVDDSKHLAFPAGCSVEQIAIQRPVRYSYDKRYVINKDLWDLMDNANKAGLIFHELLYRDAIESKGMLNSSSTLRLVNSLVAGNLITKVYDEERVEMWKEFGFEHIRVKGVYAFVNSLQWIQEDVEAPYRTLSQFNSARMQTLVTPHGEIELRYYSHVKLYPSGDIKSVHCRVDYRAQNRSICHAKWDGKNFFFSGTISFDERGKIESVTYQDAK